ncbi:PREDICTED: uncharacterized protein LOC109581756 [Amphimedon queenslandica]|uniref:Uncharacterized protein n=1 Tax=Amphimedon queenslandica TaxID=400682 RepID=A0AAN0J4M5_AMPQE|nr:PREDICTED: uncharacterized protein LOC109581756 [Amphimedon queenslandica]|eukprot:XP_019851696.1 PREDICTED: uncharacterized protein LOC109581756 [Amphimedon queenslandica]
MNIACIRRAMGFEFIWDWQFFQQGLALLLLDLGDNSQSLEQSCLNFLGDNASQYQPSAFERLLPKHFVSKIDVAYLRQRKVGAWAGDRLIVTGDYSDYSPFPPHGEWKSGCLYHLAESFEETDFSKIRDTLNDSECMATIEKKVKELCQDKAMKVVNLDKKEYLDPGAYPAKEATTWDIIANDKFNGVMDGLFIKMTHSTRGGCEAFYPSISLKGEWAGDRIVICTLDGLENYRDTSNPDDVMQALQ